MQPFPKIGSPFVDKLRSVVSPWVQYLQQFTQVPPAIVSISVTGSIFTYTAKEPGFVYINGGTVSAIHLLRGSVDLDVTSEGILPVSIDDIVKVTYTVAPTMKFIPIYGANVG